MLQVHEEGKSTVSHGSREEMERDVQAMHEYGLWATMEKAE
jgi:ATP-dependent Clp protease adaptor protein ClpS